MLFVGQANNKFMKPIKNALFLAVTILLLFFVLVLGRHWGIDPVGRMAKWETSGTGIPAENAAIADNSSITPPSSLPAAETELARIKTEPQQPAAGQEATMPESRQQNFSLTVLPKQKGEFKFAMERDYELDYHWATNGKPLYCELRGLKQDSKDGKDRVFGKLKETKGKGFFIAPFTGTFSLTWENKSDEPAVVRLGMKGVYKILS